MALRPGQPLRRNWSRQRRLQLAPSAHDAAPSSLAHEASPESACAAYGLAGTDCSGRRHRVHLGKAIDRACGDCAARLRRYRQPQHNGHRPVISARPQKIGARRAHSLPHSRRCEHHTIAATITNVKCLPGHMSRCRLLWRRLRCAEGVVEGTFGEMMDRALPAKRPVFPRF